MEGDQFPAGKFFQRFLGVTLQIFQIGKVLPLDKRNIKSVGKEYPKAEVTARNIPMDTETLRKKLGVTSGDDAHIFGLKSDNAGNLLFVVSRI